MKKILIWLVVVSGVLTSCKTDPQIIDLKSKLNKLEIENQELKDSISFLIYPPSERLSKIEALIEKDFLEEALDEIESLKVFFPKSQEAQEAEIKKDTVLGIINDKLEKALRLRAAGFNTIYESYIPALDNEGLEKFLELFMEGQLSSNHSIEVVIDSLRQNIDKLIK